MAEKAQIKIIGHRGAAGLVFENTLASIQKAIELGVSCIEIDVWQTTDEEIVVFHDAYLDRLTDKTGFISEMSIEALKNIRLKNGDSIPTLTEVIALIKPFEVQLMVEIKAENAFAKTREILENSLSYSRYIIGSFYHVPIRKLKKENPEIITAIMFECVPAEMENYLNLVNPDLLVISIETFNQEIITVAKAQNRKLVFYTVNSEPEITLAKGASPYGIVTNYPDRFLKPAIS